MSDKLNEEKRSRTIKTLVIWNSAILLFIPAFFSVEYFKSNALKKIAWDRKMTDGKDFIMVLQKAWDNYTESFVNTGIGKTLKDSYQLPPSDMANHGRPLKYFIGLFQNIAENLSYWPYMIMYRLTLDMYWLSYMTAVAIPSLSVGIMRWMVKKYNFGCANPFLNRRSMVLVSWGIYSVLLSLFILLPMPPVIGALIVIVMIPIGPSLLIPDLPKRT